MGMQSLRRVLKKSLFGRAGVSAVSKFGRFRSGLCRPWCSYSLRLLLDPVHLGRSGGRETFGRRDCSVSDQSFQVLHGGGEEELVPGSAEAT